MNLNHQVINGVPEEKDYLKSKRSGGGSQSPKCSTKRQPDGARMRNSEQNSTRDSKTKSKQIVKLKVELEVLKRNRESLYAPARDVSSM